MESAVSRVGCAHRGWWLECSGEPASCSAQMDRGRGEWFVLWWKGLYPDRNCSDCREAPRHSDQHRLASHLVRAPIFRSGGHEFESPERQELSAQPKRGNTLGVRSFYNLWVSDGSSCWYILLTSKAELVGTSSVAPFLVSFSSSDCTAIIRSFRAVMERSISW